VLLNVIIPTHDTRELTLRCLEYLQSALAHESGHRKREARVLVVDDASSDGSVEAIVERFPHVEVLRNPRARGFTGSIERAREQIAAAPAGDDDLVLLLNSDTEVAADAVWRMVETLEHHPDLGIVGASLHYSDGRAQWSGGKEPGLVWLFAQATGLAERWSKGSSLYRRLRASAGPRPRPGAGQILPVDWVPGAALLVRSRVLSELDGLDPAYKFYAQDLDLCWRARQAGWGVAIVPQARVLHHLGASGAPATDDQPRPEDEDDARRLALLWLDLLLWCQKRGSHGFSTLAGIAIASGARTGILVDFLLSGPGRGLRRKALQYTRRRL
jgi:GT2 family glycosyltransferase